MKFRFENCIVPMTTGRHEKVQRTFSGGSALLGDSMFFNIG